MPATRNATVLFLSTLLIAAAAGAQTISDVPPAILGFLDISATGTPILGVLDDSTHGIVTTVGNAVFPAGPVVVSSNGVAIAGLASAFVGFTNQSIPMSGAPDNLAENGHGYLLPFWDDLQPITGNENSTIYWQEISGVLYIMWKNIGHFSSVPGQVITFEIQVFGSPANCGPSVQFLYQDSVFGGTQSSFDDGDSATVGYIGGAFGTSNAPFSFNQPSVPNGEVVSITFAASAFTASSPFGPGSLQLAYGQSACTPQWDSYILAVTLNQGLTPGGWLYGLDIPVAELANEIAAGFPFVGPLSGSGSFTLGPVAGLPSIPIYAVVLGFNGEGVLSGHSRVVSYTIP